MTYKHALRFDITGLKAGEILARFPELKVYPEFTAIEDERWLAYVIYSQDKGSAFLRTIKDIEKRRELAMVAAGFSKGKNGAWDDERCQKVLLLQDEQVNAMIWRYLRSVMHSEEFALYMSRAEMIWQDILKIRMPIEGDKETDVQRAYQLRGQLADALPNHIKANKELEAKLFAKDDQTAQVAIELEEQMEEESIESYYQQQQLGKT